MDLKRKATGIAASIIFLMTVASCSPADDNPTPNYPASSFSAIIDGKAFYAEDISGTATAGSLTIQGVRYPGTGKVATLALSIPHYVGLTAYVIDTATKASYTEPGTTFHATTGSIIVTSNNDVHVTGTFSFDASAGGTTKTITNGKFDVYK